MAYYVVQNDRAGTLEALWALGGLFYAVAVLVGGLAIAGGAGWMLRWGFGRLRAGRLPVN